MTFPKLPPYSVIYAEDLFKCGVVLRSWPETDFNPTMFKVLEILYRSGPPFQWFSTVDLSRRLGVHYMALRLNDLVRWGYCNNKTKDSRQYWRATGKPY
jgi:hypothetical protein